MFREIFFFYIPFSRVGTQFFCRVFLFFFFLLHTQCHSDNNNNNNRKYPRT